MASQPAIQHEPEETGRAVVPMTTAREGYAIMKDKARNFAMSALLPDAIKGNNPDQAFANCLIALQMAEAMGEMPLVVMQNIHIVKGKAGFAAQYMIARANASGIFKGRINWRIQGKADTLSVTAFATLAETGEVVEFTVDMAMAKAEGWTSNSKYKTMPEVMLRYRSATFLIRFYAPDVMLGYRTVDEFEDIGAAAAADTRTATPLTAAMITDQATGVGGSSEEAPDTEAEDALIEEGDCDSGASNAEEPVYAKHVAEVRAKIDGATDRNSWSAADTAFQRISAGLPDDVREELDAALIAKRRELGGDPSK